MKLSKPWQRKTGPMAGVWYCQFDGRQINLGRDKKKANAEYNRLLKTNVIGPAAPRRARGELTAHELIDSYEAWIIDNRAPSSAEVKKYFFRDLKAHLPENLPAADLSPLIVEQFLKTQKRIKSPSTKNNRIAIVSAMFNWAIRYGILGVNPIAQMPRPTPRVRQDFLSSDRFDELLNHAHSGAMKDYLLVQLESGARTMEMLRVTAAHLHGDRFIFIIEDSKGNKKSRVVFLPKLALEIVQRLAKENPTGPLFRGTRGQPWTKDSINCQMRRLKVKMNAPWLCATTLRHSFCHWRLTQGQSASVVSKLMGHKSTRMVDTRYGHVDNSDWLAEQAASLAMPLADRNASDVPASTAENGSSAPAESA